MTTRNGRTVSREEACLAAKVFLIYSDKAGRPTAQWIRDLAAEDDVRRARLYSDDVDEPGAQRS